MRRLVPILVLGVLAAGWVGAQEPPAQAPAKEQSPEAIEILKKVDAATKAVDAVRYKAKRVPTGIAATRTGPSEGTVVMEGWNGRGPAKWWVDAQVTPVKETTPIEITAGGNGDAYFVIDYKNKKAYTDMDQNVIGNTGRPAMGLLMVEFVHDAPFDDEIAAPKVQMLGKEVVEGEECYKIDIEYGPNRGASTWYFSTKDYLPRRRVQRFKTEQGEGTVEATITALEVAPKVDASLYTLKLPDGFQKIDDFAP
jgi:hypothetical protein